MFGILSFFVFIVFQGAQAQDCVPDHVGNVTLDFNFTLYWQPSTNCDPTHYLIYVSIEDDLQYIFNTEDTFLIVDFLPACERFFFEVRAFSDGALSDPVDLVSYIPVPTEADLAISFLDASVQNGATFLRWGMDAKYAHCARAFRVVVFDRTGLPRDIYTPNNFIFLNDLIPCGHYELAVMAIYNLQEEGPIFLISYEAPGANASAPVLERILTTDTSVSLSWSLPSYSVNRCIIRALDVEGLPFLHYQYPVNDSPERPLFDTVITNLQSDSLYMLRVSIVNSEGSSRPLPIGVQTLP